MTPRRTTPRARAAVSMAARHSQRAEGCSTTGPRSIQAHGRETPAARGRETSAAPTRRALPSFTVTKRGDTFAAAVATAAHDRVCEGWPEGDAATSASYAAASSPSRPEDQFASIADAGQQKQRA